MTKFVKEEFTWDGMYLMYKGTHESAKLMEDVHPDCHPSRHGTLKPTFIARFKYGRKNWKTWVNFLVKNSTVEEYLKLEESTNPVDAMQALGFEGKI